MADGRQEWVEGEGEDQAEESFDVVRCGAFFVHFSCAGGICEW
jgi:hypothetical protein